LLCAAKTVNKQGYIHAFYQVEEIVCLSIMSTHFSTDISGIFSGLNLAHAWRYRLFEAWLASGWFKVDLLGDVKVFCQLLASITWTVFS